MRARRRASARALRPAMRSPGRPPAGRREHRVRFWAAIARGLSSEDAAAEAVEYIGWFNNVRLHEALGDIPPAEYEGRWRRTLAAEALTVIE
jgi:transposase InsO family protein